MRRAALASMTVFQSRSVRGSRGISADVRGDGEDGLDGDAEALAETEGLAVFFAFGTSALCRGDRGGARSEFEAVETGETPREDA